MVSTEATFWNAKTILTKLCTPELRQHIAKAFWKQGENNARALAIVQMSKAMHFREETIRKATPEKKAEWLLSRISAPEMNDCFEMGLMIYHTNEQTKLMGELLDRWKIPHENGTIESDDYKAPARSEVEKAVGEIKGSFPLRDIAIYLATAGLLMGAGEKEWREAMWPVVDTLVPEIQ